MLPNEANSTASREIAVEPNEQRDWQRSRELRIRNVAHRNQLYMKNVKGTKFCMLVAFAIVNSRGTAECFLTFRARSRARKFCDLVESVGRCL